MSASIVYFPEIGICSGSGLGANYLALRQPAWERGEKAFGELPYKSKQPLGTINICRRCKCTYERTENDHSSVRCEPCRGIDEAEREVARYKRLRAQRHGGAIATGNVIMTVCKGCHRTMAVICENGMDEEREYCSEKCRNRTYQRRRYKREHLTSDSERGIVWVT